MSFYISAGLPVVSAHFISAVDDFELKIKVRDFKSI